MGHFETGKDRGNGGKGDEKEIRERNGTTEGSGKNTNPHPK